MTDTVFYGPAGTVDPNKLIPGAVARRYTEPAPRGHLDVAMPCCDRLGRLHGQPTQEQDQYLAVCTRCDLSYDVEVVDERDGGYAVVLMVRVECPVCARWRGERR